MGSRHGCAAMFQPASPAIAFRLFSQSPDFDDHPFACSREKFAAICEHSERPQGLPAGWCQGLATLVEWSVLILSLKDGAEGRKLMTNSRRLIHDKNIKGWRCTACGWEWPSPRFLPAEQDGYLVCQQDFEKHKCLKHPAPIAQA
jgi:hypothetical protein